MAETDKSKRASLSTYLDYVGPFIWLAFAIAFAIRGEEWLALGFGVLAGIRLLKWARLVGAALDGIDRKRE